MDAGEKLTIRAENDEELERTIWLKTTEMTTISYPTIIDKQIFLCIACKTKVCFVNFAVILYFNLKFLTIYRSRSVAGLFSKSRICKSMIFSQNLPKIGLCKFYGNYLYKFISKFNSTIFRWARKETSNLWDNFETLQISEGNIREFMFTINTIKDQYKVNAQETEPVLIS